MLVGHLNQFYNYEDYKCIMVIKMGHEMVNDEILM